MITNKKSNLKQINKQLNYVYNNSNFYRKKFKRLPQIKNISDFDKLPFTSKKELLGEDPYNYLAVSLSDVVEVHFSSGTTNKPLPSYFTKKDIKLSSKNISKIWQIQGVNKHTIFCMLASYGLFSAGLINHYAIQSIGSFVIPASGANTDKTLSLIKEYKPSHAAAVASYYMYLLDKIKKLGVNPRDLALKTLIAGGEPFTEDYRLSLEKEFGAVMLDQYGICEVSTGLAGECYLKNGLHFLDDYVYPEVINPKTGKVLGQGERGELVLTPLYKEASPLIRYRTGDMTSITYEKCSCGSHYPRIERLKRIGEGTIFYKGIKLEVDYIASLIGKINFIDHHLWIIEIMGSGSSERIILRVRGKKIDLKNISELLSTHTGVRFQVKKLSDKDVEKIKDGKIKRVRDLRD